MLFRSCKHVCVDAYVCVCVTEEEVELAARCQAAECLLAEQQCMMGAVRGDLRSRRARATALGRSLKDEERRFLEELKRRSHKITSLSRELRNIVKRWGISCILEDDRE